MIIRKAKPNDAEQVATLLSTAIDELSSSLTEFKDKAQIVTLLMQFFKMKRNRFSYQYIDVAKIDNNIVGMVLSFPAEWIDRLSIPIEEKLPSNCLTNGELHGSKEIPLISPIEGEEGEYYIDSIAVSPKYRRQGIGRDLLEVARLKGITYRMDTSSLIVNTHNHKARKLYQRVGYKPIDTFDFSGMEYIKMTKSIC